MARIKENVDAVTLHTIKSEIEDLTETINKLKLVILRHERRLSIDYRMIGFMVIMIAMLCITVITTLYLTRV